MPVTSQNSYEWRGLDVKRARELADRNIIIVHETGRVGDLRSHEGIYVDGELHIIWRVEHDGERRHLWLVPLAPRRLDQPHGWKVRSFHEDDEIAA